MKLFQVTKKWYVLADNEDEVEVVDVSLCEPTVEVNEAHYVDSDWWDAIPAGGDDDKTCGEIFGGVKP